MDKQPQIHTDVRLKWDKFSRIGLPVWQEYALTTSQTIFSNEIAREVNFHDETQLRAVTIEQVLNGIPVLAHVCATFEKSHRDERVFSSERIPNSFPSLDWGFRAELLIPRCNDFPDGGCNTLIGAEHLFSSNLLNEILTDYSPLAMDNFLTSKLLDSQHRHMIFSCNRSLQDRLQSNPFILNALRLISNRQGFQMLNLPAEDSFIYLEGKPKRYRRYILTVNSTGNARGDSVQSFQSPPVTLELLSAYFSLFKEVLSEMNIIGIKYRSVWCEPLTVSRNEERKI